MAWSRRQQRALAVTPKISSIFSLVGSAWIIIEVLTSLKRRKHPYHRLLVAMSLYDVAESLWNFTSTWPIPTNDDPVPTKVWNIGTTGTCEAQGYFLTLSVAVPIYNAFLALYYLLVVNYNVSERTLRSYVEPSMHCFAFFWAFGTATSSLALGLLNDANLWCWIAPMPSDCLDSWRYGAEGNCIRGDNAWIYRWAFYFAPLWTCIFVGTVCTLLVYLRVKNLDKRTLRYRRPASIRVFDNSESSNNLASSSRFSFRRTSKGSTHNLDLAKEEQKDDDFLSGAVDMGQGSRRGSLDRGGNIVRGSILASALEEDGSHRPRLLRRWQSRRAIYREDYTRSVEVSQQARFYMIVFYLTHVWSTSNRIIQQLKNGSTFFGIIFVHSWFDPFQGFLNFVVYQRPRYIKLRKANPELAWWMVVWKALRFSFLPPEEQTAKQSTFSSRSDLEVKERISAISSIDYEDSAGAIEHMEHKVTFDEGWTSNQPSEGMNVGDSEVVQREDDAQLQTSGECNENESYVSDNSSVYA